MLMSYDNVCEDLKKYGFERKPLCLIFLKKDDKKEFLIRIEPIAGEISLLTCRIISEKSVNGMTETLKNEEIEKEAVRLLKQQKCFNVQSEDTLTENKKTGSFVRGCIIVDFDKGVLFNYITNQKIGNIVDDKIFFNTGIGGIKKRLIAKNEEKFNRAIDYIIKVEELRNQLFELLNLNESKILENPEDPMEMKEYGFDKINNEKNDDIPTELTNKEIDEELKDTESEEKTKMLKKLLTNFIEQVDLSKLL